MLMYRLLRIERRKTFCRVVTTRGTVVGTFYRLVLAVCLDVLVFALDVRFPGRVVVFSSLRPFSDKIPSLT